mmetsp:Transcript_15624/g.22879  ORF Transcript_15624/g.22879 Transcript_15624/m.22879 type:complete len:251 (-) Transcript_15624:130-882(-)
MRELNLQALFNFVLRCLSVVVTQQEQDSHRVLSKLLVRIKQFILQLDNAAKQRHVRCRATADVVRPQINDKYIRENKREQSKLFFNDESFDSSFRAIATFNVQQNQLSIISIDYRRPNALSDLISPFRSIHSDEIRSESFIQNSRLSTTLRTNNRHNIILCISFQELCLALQQPFQVYLPKLSIMRNYLNKLSTVQSFSAFLHPSCFTLKKKTKTRPQETLAHEDNLHDQRPTKAPTPNQIKTSNMHPDR